MKKILIFNPGSFFYGSERGLINLLRALDSGFDITVVLPGHGVLEEKILAVSKNIKIKIIPLAVVESSRSPIFWCKFIFLSLFNIFYFIPYVLINRFDYLCTNNSLLLFPSIVSKITSRKHIWFVREFFASNKVNKIFSTYIKFFSHAIVAQSKRIKERMFLIDKGVLIYEPLSSDDYEIYDSQILKQEFGLPIDSINISLISRIHPSKGQYEFIEKMADLLRAKKNVFILMAGDDSVLNNKSKAYKNKITNFINESGIKNIRFLGFQEDVSKVFALSDICVFPFLREEPFGIAVAEALLFDKPVFFPIAGGLREVYDIFGKGQAFSYEALTETINAIDTKRRASQKDIIVPDALDFNNYKEKLFVLFN